MAYPPCRLGGRVRDRRKAVSVFVCYNANVRTNVYIDGFNLYYRAVKGTPYKWLNLHSICQALVPGHEINRIRYFTALVDDRGDHQRQIRQQTYLRAISTLPNPTYFLGNFKQRIITRPLVTPVHGLPRYVDVWTTEEKGSDVNLVNYLLIDGFNNDYEQAIVISNDSDLALPIRHVRDDLHYAIGVVNPNTDVSKPTPRELRDAATFLRRIRITALRSSQFPTILSDANGTFHKPPTW